MRAYQYDITYITDYLSISANARIELDEDCSNLGAVAYALAEQSGRESVIDELGSFDDSLINDIVVTLLLGDEHIELERV
jgi:hypothetical protein